MEGSPRRLAHSPRRARVRGGRRRFTEIFVTVNSNRSPTTEAEEEFLMQRWLELFQQEVWTEAGMRDLLVFHPGHEGDVLAAEVLEPVIEVGPRIRRVHTHFTLIIQHSGRLSLGLMSPTWKDWFNERTVPELSNGVNVQFTLLQSGAVKNYNLKAMEDAPELLNIGSRVEF